MVGAGGAGRLMARGGGAGRLMAEARHSARGQTRLTRRGRRRGARRSRVDPACLAAPCIAAVALTFA